MSSNVKLVNQTNTNVTFGLWSAPNDHSLVRQVNANQTETATLDHDDARTVGAWVDSNNLYPDNDKPFTTGAYFQGGNYTVILTTSGISVKSS